SRYHMAPSASRSRPRPRKPPNRGTLLTDFRTLSCVLRRPTQSPPAASPDGRTGTTDGRLTPLGSEPDRRRTLPPTASATGFSLSAVETTSVNSGAFTGPTWASVDKSPLAT